jgi:hypothetical protein
MLPGVKDITSYGATGDGVTNDGDAIRTAIAALSSGDTLYFPSGTYLISEESSGTACLTLLQSNVILLLAPDATLKIIDNHPTDTPVMLRIGDGSTALSNIKVIGGVFNGNAANNTINGVPDKAIRIDGPVTDVDLRHIEIKDNLNGGVNIAGQDNSNRADRIRCYGLNIHDVGEGFEFLNADNVLFDAGRIVNMTNQDGFEPAFGTLNWRLTNSYLEGAGPVNSLIDVYTINGETSRGIIENNVIAGQIRFNINSGVADPETVETLTIRNNYMPGGNIAGPILANAGTIVINGNELIGPPNSTTIYRFTGIEIAADRAIITNNKISLMPRGAIRVSGDGTAFIAGNELFNNGTDGAMTDQNRCGISLSANNTVIRDNYFYDDQGSPTQTYGIVLDATCENNLIEGNHFASTLTQGPVFDASGTLKNVYGFNPGLDTRVKKSLRVTILAGQTFVRIPVADLGMSDQIARYRCQVTPIDDMTPAVRFWAGRRVSNALDVIVDAAVTSDTEFLVWLDYSGEFEPEIFTP